MARLNVKEMRESRAAAEIPAKSYVRRRVSKAAYLRALSTEGRHIATAEGEAWWREQERRYPFIMAGGNRPDGTDSPNGHSTRHGKVSYRARASDGRIVRERWVKGRWEEVRG